MTSSAIRPPQTKVGEALGYDHTYFSRLLRDENLRDDIVDKACEFLGIDKDKYFNENAFLTNDDSFQLKYEALLDRYLVEKERWLNEKHKFIDEIGELKRENADLHFRLKTIEGK